MYINIRTLKLAEKLKQPGAKMKRPESPLLVQPSLKQMEAIARTSNSTETKEGQDLRKLILTWLENKRNLRAMLFQDEKLKNKFKTCKADIVPYGIGAKLIVRPHGAGTGKQDALVLFQTLMLHPALSRFHGPCGECKRFFLSATGRKRVYCSAKCGWTRSAITATKRRRDKEHEEKIVKAQGTIQRWKSTPSRRDWKKWVSRHTGLTVQFLSRALNKGELKAPSVLAPSMK